MSQFRIVAAVDAAFEVTGRGLAPWADPHPDRSPRDEEYSRLEDPAKWRIVGARAEAWMVAAVELGLATVERRAAVEWRKQPGTIISRTDRVIPLAPGALPLVVARSRLGDVDDAGVTLGVGDPAICVALFPDCGCDACDSGSQDVLDDLDTYVLSVVSGAFRRLSSGDQEITVIEGGRRSASGTSALPDVAAVLADPTGWDDLSGASWL